MVNGLFVAKIGVPSFLVTLGMTGIITGLARWITQLKSIPVTNKTYNFILDQEISDQYQFFLFGLLFCSL